MRFACVLSLFAAAAAVAATAAPPKTSAADAAKAYGHEATSILETVDVTGDGKLLKHVLVHGTGAPAQAGATVHAHYDGRLATNFNQFDSSRKRGTPFTFPLGGGRVIKGWDLGFAGMKVGEKAILQIDSSLGYGARGAGGAIGPNAELLFEVELVKVEGGKGNAEL
jgi:FKBP-type peptidyl-prolyl cis-trans isomerase